MSEEEKKAIEDLDLIKKAIDKKYFNTRNSHTIKTILNLIKKQQKEIEELKEYLEVTSQSLDNIAYDQIPIAIQELKTDDKYKIGYMHGCNDTSKFNDKEFIRKQKILDKIEELEQNMKDFEKYWSKDTRRFKRQQCIDYYKLEALQELLDEENV